MRIRHLGIAVDSIDERLPVWESFGLKLHHTEKVDSEGVTTAHLKVGGYEIELLEPMGKDTPCLLYTSPSPRDRTRSRMPSSA